jgi:tryptophanyl-tRNA synthetase
MSQKERILTGDRPTGRLHLGHYVGSLKQRVDLQDEYEQFIIIADTQALTDNFDDPEKINKHVLELMLDYLSVGLDLEKTTFFVQSHIPAIHELFLYFANLVSIEQLSHNPTLKSELKEKAESKSSFKESTPLGFFMYPAHQIADILCVNADLVPVGEDQLPMVEMTRKIARKFNNLYGVELFKEPEAKVSEVSRLVGLDGGAKMSKSIGNCIYLSDDSETVQKKVMSMYTDPNRIKPTDPGTVEGNPVFIYHDAFNPNIEEVNELKERYKKGTVGDVEVKKKLAKAINDFLDPIRENRQEYEKDKGAVMDILKTHTGRVKKISNDLIERVREVVGVKYW